VECGIKHLFSAWCSILQYSFLNQNNFCCCRNRRGYSVGRVVSPYRTSDVCSTFSTVAARLNSFIQLGVNNSSPFTPRQLLAVAYLGFQKGRPTFPFSYSSLSSLEVGPLIQLRVWGSAISSPNGSEQSPTTERYLLHFRLKRLLTRAISRAYSRQNARKFDKLTS